MKRKFLTNNPRQTQKMGEILARESLKISSKRKALVFGLIGDLGGGKTTFLQGFAKGLGIKEKILSPTFVIMKRFFIPHTSFTNFYHIDCYRIKNPKEVSDLGFREIVKNPKNIVAIEWADKIQKIIPKETIWVKFEFISKNRRKIIISDTKNEN